MKMTRKRRRNYLRQSRQDESLSRAVRMGLSFAAAGAFFWNPLTPQMVQAMPTGAQVAAGAAAVSQNGNAMTVQQQTQNAILNWQSFNLAANERMQFLQPNAAAAILNRVVGGSPSQIFGAISANGRVFLVNPAGVLFAPGSQINVGSLVASTMNITNADFMAGQFAFINNGKDGKVINQGKIVAENKGLVAMLAPDVENSGVIVAKKGTIALAAGHEATLDFNGDGKVEVAPGSNALKSAVTNKGMVEADGGIVLMTAKAGEDLTSAVVNQDGIVRAQSLDGKAGKVTLQADNGTVNQNGTVDATSQDGKGGSVDAFAKDVNVTGTIDASGKQGGGNVRVGGDWQGSGDAPHAQNTTVSKTAAIKADATENGNGGKVAVWSDGTTNFAGQISAKGAGSGDGGKVETSGHQLQVRGNVDASAKNGKSGEWLLDPDNITITASGGDGNVSASSISDSLNNKTKVEETTTGSITIASDATISAAKDNKEATLTLSASDSITINGAINATNGKLNVNLYADTDGKSGGRIEVNNGSITTGGGNLTLAGGDGTGYAAVVSGTTAGITLINAKLDAGTGNLIMRGETSQNGGNGIDITGTKTAITAGKVQIEAKAQNTGTGTGLNFDAGTINAANVQITADKDKLLGTITGTDSTAGTMTMTTLNSGKDIAINDKNDGTVMNYAVGQISGFKQVKIGNSTTGAVTTASAADFAGADVTLEGSSLNLAQGITTTGTLTLNVDGTLTGGPITANILDVEADKKAISLDNVDNSVDTLQGTTGALTFKNSTSFSTGKITASGDVSLTASSGNITAGEALAANGKLTADASNGTFSIAKDKTVSSKGAVLTASTIALGTGAVLDGNAGDITLNADSFTLPDKDAVRGTETGTLTIDTKTKTNSFGVGTGATGTTTLSGTDFAENGFKQIVIGSKDDTGAMTVGSLKTNDPLKVISGGNITVTGKVDGQGNQLDFVAGGTDGFDASSGTITNAAGNINITADKLAFGSTTFGTADTGVLTLTTKSANAIKVGGTDNSAYLNDDGLGYAKGKFSNVIVNGQGAINLAETSALPEYTTLKTAGDIMIAGTVTDTGTLALSSGGTITEDTNGLLNTSNLLLLGGSATLDKSNTMTTVAADGITDLTLNNVQNLTVDTIENRNASPTAKVMGIKASGAVAITLPTADSTLTLNQDISATGNMRLSMDGLAGTGKIDKAANLEIYPTTAGKEINVYGTTGAAVTGDLNITQEELFGTYEKVILGRLTRLTDPYTDVADQAGNIKVDGVEFPSSAAVDIRTTGQSKWSNTNTIKGNLTIHAATADLADGSDSNVTGDLTLDLSDSMDLTAGEKKKDGKLQGTGSLAVTVPDKDIYLYDSADTNTYGGYKIAYGTINSNLPGFDTFTVASKTGKNIYLESGTLNKKASITATNGAVNIAGTVNIGAATDTAAKTVDIKGGSFNIGSNDSLIVNGKAQVTIAPTGAVSLAAGSTLDLESTDAASKITISGTDVSLGAGASVVTKGGTAEVTGETFTLGQDATITAAGNFTLNTDTFNATDARGDSKKDQDPNISGTGNLTLSTKTAATNMYVEKTLTSEPGLHITQSDLNGDIFGSGFESLTIGNANGTGTVKVDKVAFGNSVTIQNGSGTTAVIDLSGANSVTGTSAVTLKAGAIKNESDGGLSLTEAGSTINLYTNSLVDLKVKGDSTAAISGSGTLGLATYNGSKAIDLCKDDAADGALQLTNDKFTSVFGNGFSAYAIGNKDQGTINVNGSSLAKSTTLTATDIKFAGDMTMTGTDSAAKTLTLDATTAAGQTGGIITADNLLLKDGEYTLEKGNKIGTLAASAKKVDVTEAANTMLTVGTVAGTAGVTATNDGDIQLTTDKLTLTEALSGTGTLTIKQATATGTMGIGTGAKGDLQLTDSEFNGTKIKDGFSQINLGTTKGTVDIQGSPIFVDPTTIYGTTTTVDSTTGTTTSLTTNGNALDFETNTLTTTANSTIDVGAGDLVISADTMKLAGTAEGNIKGTGAITLRTLTLTRNIQLGTITDTSDSSLELPSSYFQAGGTSRVFADGYRVINLGSNTATGTLYQNGSTKFTDEVNILQGSETAGGADITGTIDTDGNKFTISSKSVTIHDATVTTGTGDVDIKTNKITVSDTGTNHSTITSKGNLVLDTYDSNTGIGLGDGSTTGLALSKDWFTGSTTSLFQPGYKSVTIGGSSNNGITVGDIDLSKTTSGVVNLKSTKAITNTSTTTGLTTSTTTVVNVNDGLTTSSTVSLTGANHISNLGNITGTTVTVKNQGDTTVTGTISATGGDSKVDTNGNVTIGSAGQIKGTSNVYVTAEGGSFTNNNTTAVPLTAGKRWVVYTEDSTGNTIGNLATTTYNRRYGTDYNTTDSLTATTGYAGNVFAYQVQPEVTVYATNTYGDTFSDFWTDKNPNKVKWVVNGVSGSKTNEKRATADAAGLETLKSNATTGSTDLYSWQGKFYDNATARKGATASVNAGTDGVLKTGKSYYGTAGGDVVVANNVKWNPLNYKVTVNLLVKPKEVTVTANSGSKVYDGTKFSGGVANNGANYTYAGFANGETAATAAGYKGEVAYTGTSQGARNVADDYTIDLSTSNLSADNYTFKYVNGTLAITPRDITVSADGATRVYGSTATGATGGKVTDGSLVDTDKIGSITYTSETTIDATTSVGKYAVTPDTVTIDDGNGGKNYKVTKANGSIEVTKRLVYITEDNKTRVYGEDNSTAVYQKTSGSTTHFTVQAADTAKDTGLVNGDTVASTTEGGVDASVTTTSNVDTYTEKVGVADAVMGSGSADNYEFQYTKGNLVITPRPVDVTVADTSKTYGDANPTATATAAAGQAGTGKGLLNGDTLTNITTTYDSNIDEKTHARDTSYAGVISSAGGTFTGKTTGNVTSVAGNYTFNYGKGNIKIDPRAITITAGDASKIYGTENPEVTTGTAVNLASFDKLGTITTATAADKTSAVSAVGGSYAITPKAYKLTTDSNGIDGDYTVTYKDGQLTINPRDVYLTEGDKTRVYGEANDTAKYTTAQEYTVADTDETKNTGLVNGDTVASVAQGITADITTASNAGTYGSTTTVSNAAIANNGKDATKNYTVHYAPGSFVITPRPVEVTVADTSKTYGDANPTATATAAAGTAGTGKGLLNGDTLTNITTTYIGIDEKTHANTTPYASVINSSDGTFTGTGTSVAGNYTFNYGKGNIKIDPREITITAGDTSKIYGTENPEVTTGTAVNLASFDTLGAITATTTAGKTSAVGSYAVTPNTYTLTEGSNGNAGDYMVTYKDGKLTVNPRNVYLKEGDKTRIYGEANDTAKYTTAQEYTVADTDETKNTGLVNGDTVASVAQGITADITTASNAGTYGSTTTVSNAAIANNGKDATKNYTVHYAPGSFVITPRPVDVTVADTSKTYGDANPTATATAAAGTAGTGKGLLNGDTLTDIKTTYTGIDEKTHANTTPYASVINSSDGTFTGTGTSVAGNYTFNYGKGNIKIDPRAITITAGDASKIYGTENPEVTTGTAVNLASFDTLGAITATTAAGKTSAVGSYAVTPNTYTLAEGSNGNAGDYTVTYKDGKLTVNPRDVYLTEGDKSRIYGEANDTAKYTTAQEYTVAAADETTGLVNGDTVASVAQGITDDITAASNAGTYGSKTTVSNAAIANNGKDATKNYTVHYAPGTFVITPRPVDVTVTDTSKTYGDANPTATATAAAGQAGTGKGLLNGDTLTNITTTYDSSMNEKTHASTTPYADVINAADGTFTGAGTSVAGNYTFNYGKGNLSITPRPITVTTEDASRVYGTEAPSTSSAAAKLATGNLVNGDTLGTIVVTSGAATESPVGSYAMTPSGLTFTAGSIGDYEVSYKAGSLTITKRPVLIQAGDASRNMGQDNPAVSAYAGSVAGNSDSGLVFGDQLGGLTTDYDTAMNAQTNPDKYAGVIHPNNLQNYTAWYFLAGSPAGSVNNYSFLYAPGTLTVLATQTPGQEHQETVAAITNPQKPQTTVPVTAAQPPLPVARGNDLVVAKGGNIQTEAFVDTKQGFGIVFNGHTGNEDIGGRSSTNGAVPVLFTNGSSKKLDGIYKINYDANKLSIEPAAQKTTIPDPKEIMNDVNKDFTLTYQSQEAGSYDVTFGNGIVAIYPVDSIALEAIDGDNHKTVKSVVATGILTSIQDLGVTADQIRAVYIFTTPEGATTTSTQKNS